MTKPKSHKRTTKSYYQKTAHLWQFINSKEGRETDKTRIYEKFKGTKWTMRKEDHFRAINPLLEARAVNDMNRDQTNMKPGNQKKLEKQLYRYARNQSVRGRREYKKALSKKKRKEFTDDIELPTVNELKNKIYSIHRPPTPGEFLDFYD